MKIEFNDKIMPNPAGVRAGSFNSIFFRVIREIRGSKTHFSE